MVSKSLYRSVDMVNSISKAIVVNQLVEESDRVLLSISGGQDSICLLVLFNQLYAQMGFHLGLFWCQHLWQTDSFSLMRQISKISFLFQFDSCFAIPSKFIPSELLARNWRHESSYRICLFYNYSKISLAHSANDKAETILLNFMRGTGATGLSPLQWTKIISEKSVQKKEHILEFSRSSVSNFFWSPFCFDKVQKQSRRTEIVLHVHYVPFEKLRCNQEWVPRPRVKSFDPEGVSSCVLQVFNLEQIYEHVPPPIFRWLEKKSSTNFLKNFINKSSNSIDSTRFLLARTNPIRRVIPVLMRLGQVGESWEIEEFKYQLYNVNKSKDSKLKKHKEMGPKNSIEQFCKVNYLSIDFIWNKFMTNPRKAGVIPKKIAYFQIFSFFGKSNYLQNGYLSFSSVPWIVETIFLKKRRRKFKFKNKSQMIAKKVKETKAKKWFSFVSYTFFKNCSISFEQI